MDLLKRLCAAAAIVIACGAVSAADAAPPTVTPSPGYDSRLQEQRAASTVVVPAPPAPAPVPPRRRRWKH